MSETTERLSQLSPLKLALAVRRMREKLGDGLLQAEPIAIVGLGCRFPGAENPAAYGELLRSGRDATSEVPQGRWNVAEYFNPDLEAAGTMYTKRGGFLDSVDGFDAAFFGIAPREARSMDPQQRMLLELAWEAFEDAGQPAPALRGSRTGVFIGIGAADYAERGFRSPDTHRIDAYSGTGSASSVAAGRLAYVLGLHGPAIAVDTACSSSLVAVHLACQSLRDGECSTAVAGGVNLILSPHMSVYLCRLHGLAPDGRCKTFDAGADGYARGEGCGLVVLKRLSDAVADGDRIHALIRGSAVNHDGASSGLTVPNGPAQEDVIRQALAAGFVSPAQIGYVEAHGTGTALGDPIEIGALANVLGAGRDASSPLVVGSVKTNIGHLEAAAGIAGLLKVVMALKQGQIPRHLNVTRPSPHIPWGELPLRIPLSSEPWKEIGGRRLAGVSAFGLSGTNAHVVLEEAPRDLEAAQAPKTASPGIHVASISARSEGALTQRLRDLEDFLTKETEPAGLADLCHELGARRTHFAHRVAIVAGSRKELLEKLRKALEGDRTVPEVGPVSAERQLRMSLAERYVQGAEVTFAAAEGDAPFRRVDLPTYPFQRERFWLDDSGAIAGHPLLGTSEETDGARRFERSLGPSSQSYLADHRILGRALFPAAAFLEMFAEAFESPAIRDLVLHEALAFPDQGARVVRTTLDVGDGARIESLRDDGSLTLHATARMEAESGSSASECLGSIEARGRCGAMKPASELYESFLEAGYEYGPAFRGVVEFAVGDGEAIARLELPEGEACDEYRLHPALLDAGLQVLGAALHAARTEDAGTFLPVGVQQVRFLAEKRTRPRRLLAYASVEFRGDETWGSLRLDTEDEKPFAELLGIQARRIASFDRTERAASPAECIHHVEWLPEEPASVSSPECSSARWLISGADGDDAGALLDSLQLEFEVRGQSVVQVRGPQPGTRWLELLHSEPWRGVVFVTGRGERNRRLLGLVNALTNSTPDPVPRFWLLTQGLQRFGNETDVRPEDVSFSRVFQGVAWGLAGVLAREHPSLRATRIDLDPERAVEPAVLDELLAGSAPDAVAIRDGTRHVMRLRCAEAPEREVRPAVRLVAASSGLLESLELRPSAVRAPEPFEVQIEVSAAGLNFRDVLGVLGLYPGDPGPLGNECAGRVTAVGSRVTDLAVGDEVFGLAPGALASFVNADAAFVLPRPRSLSPEEAAGVPVAFLTAAHALWNLARLQPGDRILVHAAAGGVGLAAVRLALLAGAEVFATAGSDDKRALLAALGVAHVFSSRTLDFADEVMRATSGRGVDVVLNSLSNEFIPRSLSILAPGGRFVEIGKRGIWSAEQVRAIRPDVTYEAFDLGTVASNERELLARTFRTIAGDLGSGRLLPLPLRVFPVEAAASAFRHMAQARHVGKIVLGFEPSPTLRSDRTYLVSGGLGALGLRVTAWLVAHGVRHVALLSRTLHSGRERELAELRAQGADVLTLGVDVSRHADLVATLAEIGTRLPPIAGVFHAAGVLDDGVLSGLSPERLERVLGPKVDGAWNLHLLTRESPLDHFVLFSSVAGLLGSVGQGSYAAANVFLDALAQHRRRSGLPALSIDWGPWSGGGMASGAESGGLTRGLEFLSPSLALSCLATLLHEVDAQAAVLSVDWPRFRRTPAGRALPLLRSLEEKTMVSEKSVESRAGNAFAAVRTDTPRPSILERLGRTPPQERHEILVGFLREQAGRVLGSGSGRRIDTRRPLNEEGLDSLMAVEFRNTLSEAFGRPLPVSLLFDHPTLEALARHLLGELMRGGATAPAAEFARTIEASPPTHAEPIAIVGMGCRFPGSARDPESFWRLLAEGREAISDVPAERWDVEAYFDADPEAAGRMITRRGGFVSGIEFFDPYFFGITPREAKGMDPQQRLLLEVAWEALEDAGIPADSLAGTQTGVFIGIGNSDYAQRTFRAADASRIDAWAGTGTALSVASGRLSYMLGAQGPSVSVDTACSASLVSVHLACQSLRQRESDLALAGGVNLILSPEGTILFSKLRALSPDGRCKAFDASADGYVRSEGCGLVVLKRLSDALSDGDDVLAVIRGSAVNQDGRSAGLTAPNGPAQEAVIRRALGMAGVLPHEVGYVEAHGTGTPLGDPIEMKALAAVFGEGRIASDPLRVGSVKTNIGHLEAAAGVAALIKTVLVLKGGRIPKHLHLDSPSSHIAWRSIPVVVPDSLVDWEPRAGRRIAGVSSFGFSGTNAHLILEEAPAAGGPDSSPAPNEALLLVISARSPQALSELAEAYRKRVRGTTGSAREESLHDVCATAARRRTHHERRLAIVARDGAALAGGLDSFLSGRDADASLAFVAAEGISSPSPEAGPDARLCALALRWISGESIDWKRALSPPSRLAHLPRTPWQRERLWIEAESARPAMVPEKTLGPLLGPALRLAPLGGPETRVYEVRIAGERLVQLLDHRVGTEALLPAAAQLEMALEAASNAFPGVRTSLSNCSFHRRLVLTSSWKGDLQIVIARLPETALASFQLFSCERGEGESALWVLLADGAIEIGESGEGNPARDGGPKLSELSDLSPSDLSSARGEEIPSGAIYQTLAASGLPYGAAFRVVQTIRRRATRSAGVHEAEATLRVESVDGKCRLEPALLDGCFQVLGVLANLDSARDGTDVPVRLARLRILREIGSRTDFTCTARLRTNGDVLEGDVLLLDDSGVPLAEAMGLRVERLASERAERSSRTPGTHEIVWEERAFSESPEAIGSWVILADSGAVAGALARRIEEAGGRCDVLAHAATSENARKVEDLLRRNPGMRGVVDLRALSSEPRESEPDGEAAHVPGLARVDAALTLAQALDGNAAAPRLFLVTRGAMPAAGPVVGAEQATLWGFAATLDQERPALRATCVDLPADVESDEASLLLSILTTEDGETRMALRQGRRLVPRVVPITPNGNRALLAALSLPPDATYLVTGGLGALGLRVADRLASRGARHLVLVGRSGGDSLDADALGHLERIRSGGAAVEIRNVDVSRGSEVQELLRLIEREGPPLRGIVHAAGALSDALVSGLSTQRLRESLLPKTAGAWNLHQFTRDVPLDFFVLFSSAAAVIGSPGQAGYGAANAYLDALAQARRQAGLPALSIAWGAWRDAGLAADRLLVANGAERERFEALGLIETQDGLRILEDLLAGGESVPPQVLVQRFDPAGWSKSFPSAARLPLLSRVLASERSSPLPEKPGRREEILGGPGGRLAGLIVYLRDEAARAMGIPVTRLTLDQPLANLGIDSLMAVLLRNQVENDLRIRVPVVRFLDGVGIAGLAAEMLALVDAPAPTDALPDLEEGRL